MIKIILIILLWVTSCASIRTGKQQRLVDTSEIGRVDKTVTINFIFVGESKNISDEKWWVNLRKCESNKIYQYMKSISPFKMIECNNLQVGDADNFFKVRRLEDIQKKIPIEFKTDYLAEIYVQYPVSYHGSGTGMWGGLLSILTLGIVPHYSTVQDSFTIYLRNSSSPEIKEQISHHSRDFDILSATWLWLAPSAESTFKGKKLSREELNNANYLLKELVRGIKSKLP